ncbi:hypothetical protein BC833DRAFT_623577 [Globomyces pollinis-pini]|nr:hypothetical protein BC833DRAFT_623577 [Globomyces pollinis-pini]
MTISPSNLQSFNNDLIKGLEHIRTLRESLCVELGHQESHQRELQQQIIELTDQLNIVTEDIKKKLYLKDEYDKLISDTEETYSSIVESSQHLLDNLHKKSGHLAKSFRN